MRTCDGSVAKSWEIEVQSNWEMMIDGCVSLKAKTVEGGIVAFKSMSIVGFGDGFVS